MKAFHKMEGGDLEQIKEELLSLLCRYIRIDTSNPPGETGEAVEFLKGLYEQEGIQYKVYEASPAKKSIAARIKSSGSTNKPLLLLNHMDVVPANKSHWNCEPFSGEIAQGYIHGRGALDMKGMAAAQIMSLFLINRKALKLNRDLIVLSVADEETGGKLGAKFIVDNFFDEFNPEFVLDEGGFGFSTTNGRPVFFVSCSQKKSLWLKIRANGTAGHGSQPISDNSNNILTHALSRLLSFKWPVEQDKSTRRLFNYLVHKDGAGLDLFNALAANTVSITSLTSGTAVNVIPSTAEATLDCRLLPNVKVEDVMRQISEVLADSRIDIEVIKRTDKVVVSDFKSEFLDCIQGVLDFNFIRPRLVPFITPVGTDSKFFRDKGVRSYGLFPILINSKELGSVHGADERVSIDNLLLGTKIIYEVCANYCTEIEF